MATDFYRNKLKHAAWTWREEKVSRYHLPSRQKDRRSGRNDKRAARALVRAEISAELAAELHAAELRLIDCDAGMCDCGDPIVKGQFVHPGCIIDES